MNRHFKKYYFYLLARCLCLFGLYDRALPYYAKVIQFRTFFFDVQKQYRRAYEKSAKKCDLEVHGGVGDFLQHLPFMLQHPKENYVVVTHFPRAKSFFENLGINIQHYHFYQLREEHHLIKENLKENKNSYPAPRQIFFDTFPFTSSEKKLDHKPPMAVIGLHMTPSAMTSNPLSRDFIDQLIHNLLSYQVKLSYLAHKPNSVTLNFKKMTVFLLLPMKILLKI
jgi:hypothetical protein